LSPTVIVEYKLSHFGNFARALQASKGLCSSMRVGQYLIGWARSPTEEFMVKGHAYHWVQ